MPKNVLTDSIIELTDVNTQKKYPEKLRLVRFHDAEQDRDFAFLTNAFHLTSLEIANLYKNRWQIEFIIPRKDLDLYLDKETALLTNGQSSLD